MPGATAPTLPQAITLEALEANFAAATGHPPGATEKSYLAQVLEDYAADETPDLSGADLAALLASVWGSVLERDPAAPARISVGPHTGAQGLNTGYDVLTIIQNDKPFLVDSVMGELAEAGVTVRSMYHPIVEGPNGRVSIILVILDTLPQERRDALGEAMAQTLADVRTAVTDHAAMHELIGRSIAHLETTPPGVNPEVLAENLAFLRWLASDHFVFLGARDYDYPRASDGGYEAEAPLSQSGVGLGVLADPGRTVLRRASEPAVLTKQMKRQLDLSEPVTVAKANVRSRVHRRSYMDYVGVKRFGADGRPSGETRFVGLFTAEAYDKAASEVPLIRRKVANALARAGKLEGTHSYKRLKNILDNYPRDELFQITEDELLEIALGILHLHDRP
ncbi:MAG: NAD-glutamate dehydrogenase, partial [Caulobacteraceae bacterium]